MSAFSLVHAPRLLTLPLQRMDDAPLPHHPKPGSVRPQDAPRLFRLRERLARRWERRRRRQVAYVALALVALAVAIALFFVFFMASLFLGCASSYCICIISSRRVSSLFVFFTAILFLGHVSSFVSVFFLHGESS